MKKIIGTSNRIIEIDLDNRQFKIITVSEDDRKKFVGGKGLALKLLFDRLKPGTDPLGPENIFIVTTGVLIGTGAPNSARFSAVSKSPLTNIITHSSCGGPFGNALKTSGFDGLILKGKSEKPVCLEIDSSGVRFRNAENIWGKTTSETTDFLKNYGKGSLTIGPAGENSVSFANIASGDRFLGRGGLGAVLGSKNVKGIVAKGGEFSIIPRNKKKFDKISKKGFIYIKKNYYSGNLYKNFGTLLYVKSNNSAEILPVNNFSASSSKNSKKISGEYVKENFNTKYQSCKNCTILCGHTGTFKGKKSKVPEYETTALLGSNLGIFDIERISEWNDICSEMGLDTISTGGTLAYIMEASERGLIHSKLKFGNPDNITETIYDIALMRNSGTEFSRGSRYLSEKYGGKEFAIQVKGLEIGGYDPRGSFGMGLNYAIANRGGCHLSSTIFGLEVTTGLLKSNTTRNKAFYVHLLENIFAAINSLHTCHFTIYPYLLESLRLRYIPRWILKFVMLNFPLISKQFFSLRIYSGLFSSVTGLKFSGRSFFKIGERVHILERFMNCREGITSKDDILPDKLMNKSSNGKLSHPFPLKKMLKKYYKIRKYENDGKPSKHILLKLGITKDL